jgi:hypothetical protein
MSDERSAGDSSPGAICPWCSAVLGAADTENCPSCGATLHGEAEPAIPGVTQIDPMAVIEGSRAPRQPRNRLMAWITGDDGSEPAAPASTTAFEPPAPEVRREMLRLQMEAELAKASAEVEALAADEALAAEAKGDQAGAKAAVDAAKDADARTDDLIESPEEYQAAQDEAAALRGAEGAGPGADGSPAGDAPSADGAAPAADLVPADDLAPADDPAPAGGAAPA